MHKDLSDEYRGEVEFDAICAVERLAEMGQSLAIARQAWIEAFDKAAAELD